MKLIDFFALQLCVIAATYGARITNKNYSMPPIAKEEINTFIINGVPALPDEFPYQAGLTFYEGKDVWWCGGSLISNEWVLTAAHCTENAESVIVSLGSVSRMKAPVTRKVLNESMIPHPDFDTITLVNDIALIKINSVNFTQAIEPIALPTIHTTVYIGAIVTASGWGKTFENAKFPPYNLWHTNLKVISNADCKKVYASKAVNDGKLCAEHYHGGAICHGDSGGPLMMKFPRILIGIASFGSPGGCAFDSPDGFTRVSYYLNWIKKQTELKI